MSDNILEMRKIAKSFGAVKALKSVDLCVRAGELHAICGENGAGKSTLMKILDGFYPHGSYEGEIMLGGQAVRMRSPADATRHGIGMIYQEIAIHPNLGVAENLFLGHLPARMGVVSSRKMAADAERSLGEIGLHVDMAQLASRLNASQQQLLMIAKALVQNPRILVLDEPTSALTLTESEDLFRILDKLKSRGVTCIYISHKLDEVFRISDRVTVLRDGETIKTFDRGEFDATRVIESMVGREVKDLYPKEIVPIGEEALRVEKLTVPHPSVRGRKIVDGVGFSVRRGEVLGIAGLVGSGRSESLGAICGSTKGAAADVYIDGVKVRVRSPKDALHNGIALVTEDRHKTGLILGATIAENITLASLGAISTAAVVRTGAQREAATNISTELRVKTPSVYAPVRTLSGGNQQKVVLGKWLLTKPRILLLDEPTRGIDVGAKSELYKLIGTLASQGTAIIMVSSELPELLAMCDRFIVLANGRVADSFDRSEASEERVMLAATGVNCQPTPLA